MPLAYSYGLSILNSHLLGGASIILNRATLLEKGFWETARECEATTFGGVPYMYRILKKLRFEQMELPALRYVTQAGGKLGTELAAEFTEFCLGKGIRFYAMYGQTEATARMSYLPWTHARTKAGSVGKAIPGGRFWLEDERGEVIEGSDVAGELVYEGKNVTMGYAEDAQDLSKGDERKGVLRTGDIATRDRDGFYYIVGRKSRFLKIFGNRVNLDEIEQLINAAGYDCACAGTDDNLKVYVAEPYDQNQILEYIVERTRINRSAITLVQVDRIPMNESGKVQYATLG